MPERAQKKCVVCKKRFAESRLFPLALLRHTLYELIHQEYPQVSKTDSICLEDMNHFHSLNLQDVIKKQRVKFGSYERNVIKSFEQNGVISKDISQEYEEKSTFGERISDRVVFFGGSWRFLISFGAFMGLWILMNTYFLIKQSFDPYPYILLNLVLSCLAAVQAPLIMMSQNRQEAKDRMRSEHDYEVNLKAELEIRHLNLKLDHYIKMHWQGIKALEKEHRELIKIIEKRKVR
ncbi:DUF1003 domain-containing protein [Candidatus Nucleicultrix amoebiphila]|jgi:uncharacterized membrane protein|uniref:Cyclic nucleotide-binding protein n=1 Tax=Candidatus Nucleicultrix amoebiphila FS5 TaxID=1414854 RepID=A0A1W6N6F5_9PROT|nr:DUF1003 domain-containing protein [Candidatus Nucleicultrix amoebiphila]ARN85362.1 hypothetical protein GQ61_08760 [Candidatus Nucleicultrix amoebiphila FS5]